MEKKESELNPSEQSISPSSEQKPTDNLGTTLTKSLEMLENLLNNNILDFISK